MSDLHERLRHQSLGRPLTADEEALAQAMEKVFRAGEQDFEALARALERDGVKRPSGAAGPVDRGGAGAGTRQDQRFAGRRLCRKRHRCLISSA